MNITKIKKILSDYLAGKLEGISSDDIMFMFEYPPEPKMGDLAFPCFKLSKVLRKSPVQIAQMLAADFLCEYVDRAEAVNGYLNIYLDKNVYTYEILSEILHAKNNYGNSDIGNGKTVVLDYSSPNVAKPFHIGHLGTTVIGHSLKLLHEKIGYKCIGINYLGDWGTQFGKLITAYKLWGDKQKIEENGLDELVNIYVKFQKESEKDESLLDTARAEFAKLEKHDAENLKLWKWFIDISFIEYETTYKQLGIKFDVITGESASYSITQPVVEELKENSLLIVDDGASIVRLDDYNMPPCMILKSDGSTIYAVRDIATVLDRKKKYKFDKCIYVTANAQILYFNQWFKVLELMGYNWDCVHIPYGTVSINGAKLATRTGNVILLKDLFSTAIEKVKEIIEEKNPNLQNKDETAEAVGVGAIVFHYLMNNRIKDINFIIEDALSFDGSTGPYAQYTYARTCSLLEKGSIDQPFNPAYQPNEEENNVAYVLSLYPEKILEAINSYEPSVITRYIIEICTAFNRFYHEHQIIGADIFRLKLTEAVKIILGDALGLICLKKPEKI